MPPIDALNHALSSIPEDRVRYHICWVRRRRPHSTDIPMHEVVDRMLLVKAGAYLFEAANMRHDHEHECHVWESKKTAGRQDPDPVGVSHTTDVLEHPELVAECILRLAERVGHDRVMAGTDCGLGGRIHPQLA